MSAMSTVTGTTPVTNSFDALAIGWRATGGVASTMTVNSISVSGQSTPPTISSAASGSLLTWPGTYLGWLLQSNSTGLASSNWVTIPGSGGATNFPINTSAAANVFYRLISP
jgi:hypothetical protein